ncbi:plasmid recombination protein [Lactococcus cremoris]|uniref:plasmid recombination protein n=1 Tax=Lactococcus lactis subsp. cremoris TaxID=1359 RepID=UPI00068F20BC|nr:plasmid recombination protein [Lactococcus cremoris]QSE64748.1 plasmid recombination protein [Lactococcus cremoris]
MNRTVSISVSSMTSIVHNNRKTTCHRNKNIDLERSKDNIIYVQEDLQKVYHQLFDASVAQYNQTQKRKDRKIINYYLTVKNNQKIHEQKEMILAIGNSEDLKKEGKEFKCPFYRTPEWQKREKALDYLASDLQKKQENFPNLKIYNLVLHLDEDNPHLHLNFVPFTTQAKKGIKKQVSMNGALDEMGFNQRTKRAQKGKEEREILDYQTNFKHFREKFVNAVIKSFQIKNSEDFNFIALKGRTKHLTVEEYKKEKDEAHQEAEVIIKSAQDVAKKTIDEAKKKVEKHKKMYFLELEKQRETLEQELQERLSKITELEQQWLVKKREEQAQIEEEKKQNGQNGKSIQQRERALNTRGEKILLREKMLDLQEKTLNESERELANRGRSVKQREAEVNTLYNQLDVQKTSIEQQQKDLNGIKTSLFEQNESLNAREKMLRSKESMLSKRESENKARRDDLELDREQFESERRNFKIEYQDFRATVEAASTVINTAESKSKELKAQRATLESDQERFRRFSQEVTEELERIKLADREWMKNETLELKEREKAFNDKLEDPEVKRAVNEFETRQKAKVMQNNKTDSSQVLDQKINEWLTWTNVKYLDTK